VIDMSDDTEIASETPWHPRAALFFSREDPSTSSHPHFA
jgi:hypothetical protein